VIEPKLFKNLYNLEHKKEKTYDFNLDEYKDFLKEFDNPQKEIGRKIHISGTNGKGSVAEMLTSILVWAGYRVGTYTSPHIREINERIKIDGQKISDSTFKKFEKIIYKKIVSNEHSYRTYFEALTTLAFLYFRKMKTDFSIIETGLGGRLDSTNVIESEISVITKIGFDHTDILGKTLEKITFEKAGIIKNNQNVFTFKQKREILEIIKREAEKKHSNLNIIDSDKIVPVKSDLFIFEKKKYTLHQIGSYQRENAALAVKVAESANISYRNIKEGLGNFRIEGRLEIVNKKPMIILDGSHNPQAIERTMEEVRQIFPKKTISVISIFMADKNYRESIGILKKYAEKIIITQIPFFRCAKKSDYKGIDIDFEMSVKSSLKKAVESKTDIILFTGSFYLISHAKKEVEKMFFHFSHS